MQSQEGLQGDGETGSPTPAPNSEYDDWPNFPDDDITQQQQSAFPADEAVPFVGDKARAKSPEFIYEKDICLFPAVILYVF